MDPDVPTEHGLQLISNHKNFARMTFIKSSSFTGFLFQTFISKKLWRFWLLIGVVILAYLVNIKLAVALNEWNGRFYNALQSVKKDEIFDCLYDFTKLCSAIIAVLVTADYLQGRAALIAREELTFKFFNTWLSPDGVFYKLRVEHIEPDNPDQRIAEDIRDLINIFLNLCTSFLNSVLMIGSFSVILWNLSGPIKVFGYTIPGYMFWVCLIYTALETLLTHLIGRKLKFLNFESQKREANLRSALLAKRTNAESIAGFKGEQTEKEVLHKNFRDLLTILIDILKKKRNLEYFSVGVGQITHLTPIFFSLPTFLAGHIALGGLMQIRGAFVDVARSLSWIAMSYQTLAKFVATYERLSTLHSSICQISNKTEGPTVENDEKYGLSASICFLINKHGQRVHKIRARFDISKGSIAVLQGPSGSGKSTILRTLAGFNPQATGLIKKNLKTLWVPQNNYILHNSLKANLLYPQPSDSCADEQCISLLDKVGLGFLAEKLHTDCDWSNILSGGEKQRLILARIIFNQPGLALLDEVTSALDESSALKLIDVLKESLTQTAVLLVTHQSQILKKADLIFDMKDFYVASNT